MEFVLHLEKSVSLTFLAGNCKFIVSCILSMTIIFPFIPLPLVCYCYLALFLLVPRVSHTQPQQRLCQQTISFLWISPPHLIFFKTCLFCVFRLLLIVVPSFLISLFYLSMTLNFLAIRICDGNVIFLRHKITKKYR